MREKVGKVSVVGRKAASAQCRGDRQDKFSFTPFRKS
jgi:hypothetical protein